MEVVRVEVAGIFESAAGKEHIVSLVGVGLE